MVQRQLYLAAILGCGATCHAMCVQAILTGSQHLSKQQMCGPVLSSGSPATFVSAGWRSTPTISADKAEGCLLQALGCSLIFHITLCHDQHLAWTNSNGNRCNCCAQPANVCLQPSQPSQPSSPWCTALSAKLSLEVENRTVRGCSLRRLPLRACTARKAARRS